MVSYSLVAKPSLLREWNVKGYVTVWKIEEEERDFEFQGNKTGNLGEGVPIISIPIQHTMALSRQSASAQVCRSSTSV